MPFPTDQIAQCHRHIPVPTRVKLDLQRLVLRMQYASDHRGLDSLGQQQRVRGIAQAHRHDLIHCSSHHGDCILNVTTRVLGEIKRPINVKAAVHSGTYLHVVRALNIMDTRKGGAPVYAPTTGRHGLRTVRAPSRCGRQWSQSTHSTRFRAV